MEDTLIICPSSTPTQWQCLHSVATATSVLKMTTSSQCCRYRQASTIFNRIFNFINNVVCTYTVFTWLWLQVAGTSIEMSKDNLIRLSRVLLPPDPEVLSRYCKQGFEDALRFLQRRYLISCTRCLAVDSTYEIGENIIVLINVTLLMTQSNLNFDQIIMKQKLYDYENNVIIMYFL